MSNMSTGITTFEIKVKGAKIPDETPVFSIEVNFSVNKISLARIVVLDGEANTGEFKASSSSIFIPGSAITIEAGYENQNKLLFKGVICTQHIRINDSEGSVLEVECRDTSIAASIGRKSKTFSNKKDSEIISAILGEYSDVSSSVKATTIQWPQMVQYYTTDWDFILSRAEANGLIVTTINGKIAIINPIDKTTSVLKLTYGIDIIEFNGELNSTNQLGNVKASSWDYTSQKIVSGASTNNYKGAGNLSSKKLSEVVGLKNYELQTSASLNKDDLTNWSKAQMIKSELSKFYGEVTCKGTHLVLPGNFIELQRLGDRFNGDHFVSGVTHTFSEGNWVTEIAFGLSTKWFTETLDVIAPTASGLLPGVNGLFTATVKKTYEDPENQYRILIDIPLFDPKGEGLWARFGSFYASSNAGAFFLPEVGDEVIVGFLNEDPRFPIILGSLYSNDKLKPFEAIEPNEKNTKKAIVSKSGIKVVFDDEKKDLIITTPANNTLTLSDNDKQVTLQDQNNNSIVMSESGIEIKSVKSISIQSDQNLTLKGTQGVNIESSAGDVSISGVNIKQTADMEFSAEGNTNATVQGGGELTLKGAMIMIN